MKPTISPALNSAMTLGERRAVSTLAGLFGLRMLGLFMIMPVFAVYGRHLQHATPFLIGLAVGVYALAQVLLQIPLAQLSDRIGRKRLILVGMALFAVGGAVAALSASIWGVILGRALQGSGAISGVVMALAADLTRVEQRTKAMAVMGMSIGVAFGLAFVAGPLLAGQFGLSGLFWATSILGVGGMAVCYYLVPNPVSSVPQNTQTYWQQFRGVLAHTELLRLNWGIFSLHIVLAAFFMSVPVLLKNNGGLAVSQHGWVYLPVLLLSFVAIIPAIIVAEKKRQMKAVFVGAIAVLLLSMVSLAVWHESLAQIVAGLVLFFIGFNLLEALLPSLVSKICPAGSKGAAMGLYATAQFFGAFLGSPLGSAINSAFGYGVLFALLAAVVGVWCKIAAGMAQPPFLSSVMLSVSELTDAQASAFAQRLRAVAGVQEAVVVAAERVAYLKVDRAQLDQTQLDQAAQSAHA